MIEIFSQRHSKTALLDINHIHSTVIDPNFTLEFSSAPEYQRIYFIFQTSTSKMGGGDIPPPPHSRLNIGLILSCVFTFIITTIFNALAGSGGGVGSVFYATVGGISRKFELFITPASNKHFHLLTGTQCHTLSL